MEIDLIQYQNTVVQSCGINVSQFQFLGYSEQKKNYAKASWKMWIDDNWQHPIKTDIEWKPDGQMSSPSKLMVGSMNSLKFLP